MNKNTVKTAENQAEKEANGVESSNVDSQEMEKRIKDEKPDEYLRVGTQYYKKIKKPLDSGIDFVNVLERWDKTTILEDHNKTFLSKIGKYDAFVNIPNHLNYKQRYGTCYNKYEPFSHEPKEGNCENTLAFIKHIFREHYELGLEYIKVLLEKPTQTLPILCLQSKARETGKTTFLNWLKLIFQGNMTINTNEDFRSTFNSDWAGKLIIAVDETLLNKVEDTERLKTLSTSRHQKVHAKNQDKKEVNFFGKFILNNNPKDNEPMIRIDREENRFWVREVPSIKQSVKRGEDFLEDLKKEIPAFLHYLMQLKYKHGDSKSRMWFNARQIKTEALTELKNKNRSNIEKEVIELLKEQFFDYEVLELKYTPKDLLEMLLKVKVYGVSKSKITSLLKDNWQLQPNEICSTYKVYNDYLMHREGTEEPFREWKTQKGRFYTFFAQNYLSQDEFEKLDKHLSEKVI